MCYDPKILRKELGLSYISKCEPIRAGICGVSRRNKGSAGRKILFYPAAKHTCAMISKL
jgi:hypothetical protein